jgi:hypothetical protein
MKIKALALLLCIVLLNRATAQTDTIKKFQSGSYILKHNTLFELHNDKDSLVALWESMKETVTIDRISYPILKIKNSAGKQKSGLIDMRTGDLIFPIEYDALGTLGNDLPVVILRKENKIGLYSTRLKKYIPPKYTYIRRSTIGSDILLGDSTDTFIVDEVLNYRDTIKGMINVDRTLYGKNKRLLVIQTKEGEGVLMNDYTAITNKGWKSIQSFKGNILVVSDSLKYGLYDMLQMKWIAKSTYKRMINADYTEQIFLEKKEGWNLLTPEGKLTLQFKAEDIKPSFTPKAFYFKSNGLWGLMNNNGAVIQKPTWQMILDSFAANFEVLFADGHKGSYYMVFAGGNERTVIGVKPYESKTTVVTGSEMHAVENLPDMIGATQPVEDKSYVNEENKIFTKMEIDPSFMSDHPNEKEFIKQSILTYKKEQKFKSKGKVVLVYLIEKDGKVSSVRIESADNDAIVRASKAIMEKVKKWNPGLQNGRVVRGERRLEFEW